MGGPPPYYCDEALVKLVYVDPPADLPYPVRYIHLGQLDKSRVNIGRTSKHNPEFKASKNNGYFDSAVMSRKHAQLIIDCDEQRVCLKDNFSLHGSAWNDEHVWPGNAYTLQVNDILKFGIMIEKGAKTFPPCVLKVENIAFGTHLRHIPPERSPRPEPEQQPVVFKVPDDSEIAISSDEEDVDENDDDDVQIQHSAQILHDSNLLPATTAHCMQGSSRVSIDLTSPKKLPNSKERRKKDHKIYVGFTIDDESPKSQVVDNQHDEVMVTETEGHRNTSATDHVAHDDEYEFSNIDADTLIRLSDFERLDSQNDIETHSQSCSDSVAAGASSDVAEMEEAFPYAEEDEFEEHDEFDSDDALEAQDDDVEISGSKYPHGETNHENSLRTRLEPSSPSSFVPSRLDKEMENANSTSKGSPRHLKIPLPPMVGNETGHILGVRLPPIRSSLGSEYQATTKSAVATELQADPPAVVSGTKFLQSPPEGHLLPTITTSPQLDMTSAYQFELSKKNAGSEGRTVKRTHVGINDIVDSDTVPAKQSLKRKAEGISKLTPEEEFTEARARALFPLAEINLPNPAQSARDTLVWTTANARQANSTSNPRPTKRLRRVAEVLGYAALGGVAVMSALIATAPTL